MKDWPLYEARSRFSAVVDAAVAGEPQRVTRRGKPAVVVVAAGEYERLCRLEKRTPPGFAELLLSMPDGEDTLERPCVRPRNVGF